LRKDGKKDTGFVQKGERDPREEVRKKGNPVQAMGLEKTPIRSTKKSGRSVRNGRLRRSKEEASGLAKNSNPYYRQENRLWEKRWKRGSQVYEGDFQACREKEEGKRRKRTWEVRGKKKRMSKEKEK